jgi:hypothetical protein
MWKNIEINIQNIEIKTDKAVLFKCPHKSDYDGYTFWHPLKLVRDGSNSYAVSVGYTNDFEFTLRKYGGGKHNSREVISEKKIGAEEFEKMLKTMDDNITAPKDARG